MTEDQIKHMVDRFLGWQLPKDFNPDAGISYARPDYPDSYPGPSGTNLLDAAQAEAMVRHMVEGLPQPLAVSFQTRRPANCPRGTKCSGAVVSFGEGKIANTCGLAGCMHNHNQTHGGCGVDRVVA